MKIVVWGANGFIGAMLVKRLIDNGDSVVAVDFAFSNLDSFKQNPGIKLINVNDIEAIDEVLSEKPALINLAAKRLTPDFSFDDYFQNIQITMDILRKAAKFGITNVVTISSIGVYSESQLPWRENETDRSMNLYGQSKRTIDSMIEHLNNFGFNIKSLRLAQVIGLHERKGFVLNTFIDQAKNRNPLKIYGSGSGARQYIYIEDVISAILVAVYSNNKGIYNIGLKGSVTILQLAELINQVFDNPSNIEYVPYDREDLNHYEMDVEKAYNELRWTPEYSIEEALHEIKKKIEGVEYQ